MAKNLKKKEDNFFAGLSKDAEIFFIAGEIRKKIKTAIKKIGAGSDLEINLEHPEDPSHGDYSTNVSFVLARVLKKSPLEIGESLAAELKKDPYFSKVEFIKPGFLNFFLAPEILISLITSINKEGESFGKCNLGRTKKIQVEFISANPTGPLTLPNARGGFTGDTLARVLESVGFKVEREYYINDYGNQVKNLGASVNFYYQQLKGKKIEFPENGYEGEYVGEIAKKLFALDKNFSVEELTQKALELNLDSARATVKKMGINFDIWFRESVLHHDKKTDEVLEKLKNVNKAYEKDDATWLKSSEHGDDKDRVLMKKDGGPTYILGDLAYHLNKYSRGFDQVINVWGADHHGDIARLKAGLHFLGIDENRLQILLVALMKMESGGQEVRISKRKGNYVLMDELLAKVPLDVLRFFSLMYDVRTPMVFNLDLALDKSERNPVYYVEYAYARLCSIIKKAPVEIEEAKADWSKVGEAELSLVKELIKFSELVINVASSFETHHLTHYAINLARQFHAFYHQCRVITEDKELSRARLELVKAVKIVLGNCLNLLGVEAPEKM